MNSFLYAVSSMRLRISAALLFTLCRPVLCQDQLPGWFSDAKGFCTELANRTNGRGSPVPIGKPKSVRFTDYPSRPVAPQRSGEAVIGKDEANDEEKFARAIKLASLSGPDFAGRYAIIRWSCGTWCSNAVIADVITGKVYDPPFVGVIGCEEVTGSFDTLQRRADSSLLIVRGSLEMSFGNSFSEGPCRVFYFRWQTNRLRLLGCEIKAVKQ